MSDKAVRYLHLNAVVEEAEELVEKLHQTPTRLDFFVTPSNIS
jgi:hypothetical protein